MKRLIPVIDDDLSYAFNNTEQHTGRRSYRLTVLFLPFHSPYLKVVETMGNRNLKDIRANCTYTTNKIDRIIFGKKEFYMHG